MKHKNVLLKNYMGEIMSLFSKIKNITTKYFREVINYENINSDIQLKIRSRFTLSRRTNEQIKQDIIAVNSLFDTFAKIYSQLNKLSTLPEFKKPHVTNILEDGRIEFVVLKDTKEHPTLEKFATLEYVPNNNEEFYPFETYDAYGNKTGKKPIEDLDKVELDFLVFMQNRKVYILSKNEFDEYAGTKFNSLFFNNSIKMNELYKSKELEEAMLYLIPQYEISFNTILNVLNAHIEKKPDKKLSSSMEDKIVTIFESFDKKVMEVDRKKKEMSLLEDEGFERSLEELLDFELQVIEKNEQLQRQG